MAALFSILFLSCNDQKKELKSQVETEKVNFPSDFNQFIGKHKAKAMVLGVFHFGNPGLDSYKDKFYFNILEKQRQAELDTLLNKIAAYRPTKILLEWNRIKSDSLANSRYKDYLKGAFHVTEKGNEVYQIGFKLAKRLGHDKVYCSDASADWFGVDLDWDNFDENAYLKKLGQYEKATRYNYENFYRLNDSLKNVQSLTDHLILLNSPESRLKSHQRYLTENVLQGAGDNYFGADGVARWYRRNLRIFANAYDVTSFDEEERLLLIYGSGHVWQLRQFFMDSPDFEYVEPNEYLTQ